MRGLYVCATHDISGAETVFLRFLKRQPALDCAILVPAGKLRDELVRQGRVTIRSYGLGQMHRARKWFWPVEFLFRWLVASLEVFAACLRLRPDFVQPTHFGAGIYTILPARLFRLPVVWHIHDIFDPGSLEAGVLGFLGLFDIRIVAVSRAVRDAAVACGIPASRITVIYNGIDWQDEFAPGNGAPGPDLREQYGQNGCALVGIVGLLTSWKGQDVLLRAAAVLRTRCTPSARFLVIGGSWIGRGDYERYLIRLRDELGLQDSVQLTGHISDIARAVAALDIVVHASVRPDPLPTVVLEAMAMGKVVIASRCGGVPEMIEHGVTGLLCPPGDVEALAATLQMVLEAPEKFRHLGENARRLVAERFDAGVTDARMLQLYDEIAAS